MKTKIIVKALGLIELFIGLVTITSLLTYSILSLSKKPLNVFIFVLTSSITSIILGCGLWRMRGWARSLLLFFSGYIVLTKFLMFAGLLRFNGEIITFVPYSVKNTISVAYHILIMLFLSLQATKGYFRNTANKGHRDIAA